MNSQYCGTDGFYFPIVYQKNQKQVDASLSQGEIDYADLTKWSFPDEFLCFVWERKLLAFINSTYPNPRERNEVPIWFLICCQFVMRLHQTGHYHHLGFLLNSGSLLTPEQRQGLIYHPCYTLSTLLNVAMEHPQFHVASYELGAGNEDELVHAKKIVPEFCNKFSGVMKLLIIDRGYIDGEFIGKIKRDHHVDVLIPLRKNMTNA